MSTNLSRTLSEVTYEQKAETPSRRFQEGFVAHVRMRARPAIGHSQVFHPNIWVSVHLFQQGNHTHASTLPDLRSCVFQQNAAYLLSTPLVPSNSLPFGNFSLVRSRHWENNPRDLARPWRMHPRWQASIQTCHPRTHRSAMERPPLPIRHIRQSLVCSCGPIA
jgi:hypothetical protein